MLFLHNVWLKMDETWGSSNLLKMLASEILQTAPDDPKGTLHIQGLGLRVTNFHNFVLQTAVFILRFSHKFLKLGRFAKNVTACIPPWWPMSS